MVYVILLFMFYGERIFQKEEFPMPANMKKMAKSTNFRWAVAWLIFTISFMSYMDRVNLSVATPAIMQEFGLTKIDMGMVQSVFFLGYALCQVPGGMMAERFGQRITGAIAVVWWSFFTILTAVASGKFSFAFVRAMFGLGEAPLYPAAAITGHRWFNAHEKGAVSSFILCGCFLGPVFGPMITVALMGAFGWKSVFLLFGAIGFLLGIVWYTFVKDNPKDSAHVNESELAHINKDRVEATGEKKVAPWKRLLKSGQFWALGLQFLATDYIMYVFLSWLPVYLMEAHGFSMKEMGFWAATPWIALILVVICCGRFSDRALAKGYSENVVKTVEGAAGILICSAMLFVTAQTTSAFTGVACLSVALGALGLSMSAAWSSVISMGREYAGSVSGWMNLWGNIGGVLAPTITAWAATNMGWSAALVVTAGFGVFGAVMWLFVKPAQPVVAETPAAAPVEAVETAA